MKTPTIRDIKIYASKLKISFNTATMFHKYYSGKKWLDKNNYPIVNWKSLFLKFSEKEIEAIKEKRDKILDANMKFNQYLKDKKEQT